VEGGYIKTLSWVKVLTVKINHFNFAPTYTAPGRIVYTGRIVRNFSFSTSGAYRIACPNIRAVDVLCSSELREESKTIENAPLIRSAVKSITTFSRPVRAMHR